MNTKKLILLFIISLSSIKASQLGATPQMGWNSWNHFACFVHEEIVRAQADYIAENGLRELGYVYVNIDDCWANEKRDPDGHVVVRPLQFPSGMKALGDYIHSKGLKFGIYSDAGEYTCAHQAGSLYYEDTDVSDYVKWGVDYLKYDNCNNLGIRSTERYQRMRDALDKADREIFFAICNWGEEDTTSWAPKIANSWRTTGDINDSWDSMAGIFLQNQKHPDVASPGHWNDPDMLEIGNGGMSLREYRSHFALWCFAKAPLLLGNDLTRMDKPTREIIMNKDLIDVNQDRLGIQAVCKVNCFQGEEALKYLQVYSAPMENGDIAVLIINWTSTELRFVLELQTVDLQADVNYRMLNLWTKEIKEVSGKVEIPRIRPHGNTALRFKSSNRSDS